MHDGKRNVLQISMFITRGISYEVTIGNDGVQSGMSTPLRGMGGSGVTKLSQDRNTAQWRWYFLNTDVMEPTRQNDV